MRMLVLPEDGIGPEITAAAMTVPERADALSPFEHDLADFASLHRCGRGALVETGRGLGAAVDRVLAQPGAWSAVLGPLGTRVSGQAVAAAFG
jgi:isocitrate/isopropylmalate dehydrogenase